MRESFATFFFGGACATFILATIFIASNGVRINVVDERLNPKEVIPFLNAESKKLQDVNTVVNAMALRLKEIDESLPKKEVEGEHN